ncbi:hypothetical protein COZ61_02325 [Candidatus Berkelbacteria bacterium CG_4_8_14_3_um_filter_33_6]|uniref:t-SNARE coiled-coil homology domain-containing protein n=1 Tax=Candidatus Berkelbacteria bacterium CG10_big_fil_rev_8_21_14_0_10_43_14 TaxID=1974515 RepID=A0A2M6R9M1_9BACT|nr:MAG: hypothetical protein COT79_00335 [Candidatus Berkelbacteria bacterium CG10_big_fil_rev_8_21_14_0_10_43_14]PIX30962.1 MAG: hypothetical protein COZ61_02325 [Candidatus Berkelbacteria bacterium CG_4_8_14_3_um_filter_33_6]PIZ27987.1 MAG: hypothetical protein COY43_02975 [Candidatus Berkelbacteria bacterium CG_4_10_14_0_8_um_filter_35_9_33_8]
MSLTKQDLQSIKGIVTEEVTCVVREEVESLAVMVNKTFNTMEKRFNHIDKRFNHIDKRFDKIEHRLGNIESDIRQIKSDINNINERLTRLEKRTLEDDDVLSHEVIDLRNRLTILEKQVKQMKLPTPS